MARFLIDANLPYRFALWHGEDYLHVYDLRDNMPDAAIWQHALAQSVCFFAARLATTL